MPVYHSVFRKLSDVEIPIYEYNALVAFYFATDGPSWTTNTNWLTDADIRTWHGVTVTGTHVTGLTLNDNLLTLSGAGLQYLSPLTQLNTLQLQSTGITGDLSDLSTMAEISTLRLSNTAVTGDLTDLALMTDMFYIDLATTAVTGVLSDLSAFTGMQTILLSNTAVTGNISAIAPMTQLITLDINDTGISDYTTITIPTTLLYVDVDNTGLDETEMDTLLYDIDLVGSSSGTFITGGSNSIPALTGYEAAENMESRSWIITGIPDAVTWDSGGVFVAWDATGDLILWG